MYVPSPEIVLGNHWPLKSDAAQLQATAQYCAASELSCASYRDSINQALQELLWLRSSAVMQLQTKLAERLAAGATMAEETARVANRAFESFAQVADDTRRRADRLYAMVDEALETIRREAGVIQQLAHERGVHRDFKWNERVGFQLAPAQGTSAIVDGLYAEWRWRIAVAKWHEALDVVERTPGDFASLHVQFEHAAQMLLAELRGTHLGQISQFNVGETSHHTVSNRSVALAYAVSGEYRGHAYARGGTPHPELHAMLGSNLTPQQRAARWGEMRLTQSAVSALPIETLVLLASADGLPASVQHQASIAVLHHAVADPRAVHELLGFSERELPLDTFRSQVLTLHSAWLDADLVLAGFAGDYSAQLVGLNNHDGVLAAAISHGDLDTASHVGVNVSGMFSGVATIDDDAKAARSILREALTEDPTQQYAVVTWVGYKSPHLGNVTGLARAEAGAQQLAAFLIGVQASRDLTEIENLTVLAHSYGSTTSAEALKLIPPAYRIDNFVAYGSAGFANNTNREQLQADEVFAVEAAGDGWAWAGRTLFSAHSIDPVAMQQVSKFSAAGGDGYLRVTAHSMFTADDAPSLSNWLGHVGYTTPGTRTVRDMGHILATGGLPQ